MLTDSNKSDEPSDARRVAGSRLLKWKISRGDRVNPVPLHEDSSHSVASPKMQRC